jgi:hypothetical protein
VPIRQLGLAIADTPLEPVLQEFDAELDKAGIKKLRPRFYLSNEWGVPFGTIAVAIPFYLAHPQLTSLHAARTGFVEGTSRRDILRYLRHEMGHVVNYGYRLFEQEEWVQTFGSMDAPYQEEYRPQPFSRRFVQHLPGWYAQKHPDEDWAETFAVWLTPDRDWRDDYSERPIALAKLEYCDRTIKQLANVDPVVTAADLDQDVSGIDVSLSEFYATHEAEPKEFRHHLDTALRTIFEDDERPEDRSSTAERVPAASVLKDAERQIMAEVYRWTGHGPERTQRLLRQMRRRCDALKQVYPADRREQVVVALTALATALAMNHVNRGEYLP